MGYYLRIQPWIKNFADKMPAHKVSNVDIKFIGQNIACTVLVLYSIYCLIHAGVPYTLYIGVSIIYVIGFVNIFYTNLDICRFTHVIFYVMWCV